MTISNLFDAVTITPVEPAGRRLAAHLNGDDELTGGAARWEVLDRPRRRSATEWIGTDPHQKVLPLMLDGMDVLPGGTDVVMEGDCELLSSWCRPDPGTEQPAVLALDGPLILPAYRALWVITNLEWGARVRAPDRQRIQQEVTVTLLEHTAADILVGPAAAARARAGF